MALHRKITDETPIALNPLYSQRAEGGTRPGTRSRRASSTPTSRSSSYETS